MPEKTGWLARALTVLKSPAVWARTAAFAALSYAVFGWLVVPLRVRGDGMEPTYRKGSTSFSWRGRYWLAAPGRFDVVSLRLPQRGPLVLRRVVALEGESVEFRGGRLMVDGKPVDEPHAGERGNWTMLPARVRAGCCFVVGDNRSGRMDQAVFGQVARRDIVGGPLW